MKHNINLNIVQTKNNKDITYDFQGRLLGIATHSEAIKIFNNWSVAHKVYTNSTKEVKTVIKLLEVMNENVDVVGLGHIVMTISDVKKDEDANFIPSLSRQLLISPPITLVTEEIQDSTTDITSVVMKCGNGTLLTMEETLHE